MQGNLTQLLGRGQSETGIKYLSLGGTAKPQHRPPAKWDWAGRVWTGPEEEMNVY